MTRWEYQTVTLKASGFFGGHVDDDEMRGVLNSYGEHGWELVNGFDTNAANGHTKYVVFVFKRPVD